MNSATKFKVDIPEKAGVALRPIIDDIIYDIHEANEIVTERIYENVKNALHMECIDTAKAIVMDYSLWLKSDEQNLNEEFTANFDEFLVDETSINESEEISEARGRVQTLRGMDLKKRKAKAEIMSKLNKDPQYIQASQKLLMIANRVARKLAREAGIKPNLVDVSKVIVRKSTITKAQETKPKKEEPKDNKKDTQ
ncbi:hypothetical protein HYO65_gp026 [Tenacibaculum phage PTm1]|nr:hypothetical protein HYO65_gp026 [Tenacibaculum phage PTm1]BBI90418.1 hypothetical protein [Tenacibaculum phage PTm1]